MTISEAATGAQDEFIEIDQADQPGEPAAEIEASETPATTPADENPETGAEPAADGPAAETGASETTTAVDESLAAGAESAAPEPAEAAVADAAVEKTTTAS